LGAARAGIKVDDPAGVEETFELMAELNRRTVAQKGQEFASYDWLARVPELFPPMLKENLVYFFFGKHTGLLLYMPFGVAAALLFLLHGRGSPDRWLTLASLAIVALFFVIWIHYNWHGGSGFVGNRYFVNAYPALLFLVTVVRPDWIVVPGSVLAGLFLGPLLFTPYGAPVPEPTLQSHVRGAVFDLFPRELTLVESIPGYDGFGTLGASISGRRDLFRVADAAERAVWVRGAATTRIWITTQAPFESLTLEVSSFAPDNVVELDLGGATERLVLDGPTEEDRRRVVELPARPAKRWSRYDVRYATYLLDVTTATGRNPRHPGGEVVQPQFYLGAQIVFLGFDGEVRARPGSRVGGGRVRFPHQVRAGDELQFLAEIENRGAREWHFRRKLPVRVSYRWRAANGVTMQAEGLRSSLGRDLPPGASARARVSLAAPEQPGSYVLVLDAWRDQIGWLSQRGGETREIPIDVLPALY
ncbi:MAG: hypothetical protein R3325_00415, partial [Thermoanaerobaculia bacterium]|nr:hypothetical protein [Thermoanaerobaculia bacterium]